MSSIKKTFEELEEAGGVIKNDKDDEEINTSPLLIQSKEELEKLNEASKKKFQDD